MPAKPKPDDDVALTPRLQYCGSTQAHKEHRWYDREGKLCWCEGRD